MFKVNNKNSRTRCEICSELIIKTPERRKWRRSGVLIVTFEQVIADWIPVPLSYNHSFLIQLNMIHRIDRKGMAAFFNKF